MSESNFYYVDRGNGFCWKHKIKTVWVVFYDTTHRSPFYEAYRVKQYAKYDGKREPWTFDNERVSSGDGFNTLEEAIRAAEEA